MRVVRAVEEHQVAGPDLVGRGIAQVRFADGIAHRGDAWEERLLSGPLGKEHDVVLGNDGDEEFSDPFAPKVVRIEERVERNRVVGYA